MNLSDSKGYFKGRRDADGNIVLPMPQKMSLTEYGDTYIFKVCIFNKEKVDTSVSVSTIYGAQNEAYMSRSAEK